MAMTTVAMTTVIVPPFAERSKSLNTKVRGLGALLRPSCDRPAPIAQPLGRVRH